MTNSPASRWLLPLSIAVLSGGALAQVDDPAEFARRREEIRARYLEADRASDLEGKRAAVLEMEALEAGFLSVGDYLAEAEESDTRDPGELSRPDLSPGLGANASTPRGVPLAERSSALSGLLATAGAHAPILRRGAVGRDVAELQKRLSALGFSAGRPDGVFGPGTEKAVKKFQKANGLDPDGVVGPDTWSALAGENDVPASSPAPPTSPGGARLTNLPFTPNATALAKARNSAAGKRIANETAEHAETYRRASELTGVPAILIAALHANESGQGTYGPSIHGPESGYGLDDRYVTNAWGNAKLAKYGLGRWERGRDTPRGRLQSAVVAAEHLKRMAGYAGITIGPNMTAGDLAGTATSYIAGVEAGRSAKKNGRSWMFDTSDPNPHPRHPGGTSRGPGGRTIRVPASRKEGLLRWDTLLPLLEEQLR